MKLAHVRGTEIYARLLQQCGEKVHRSDFTVTICADLNTYQMEMFSTSSRKQLVYSEQPTTDLLLCTQSERDRSIHH